MSMNNSFTTSSQYDISSSSVDVRDTLRNDYVALPSSSSYEVVTTNYGWNTPDGSQFPRRIVTTEFFNAVLEHDHYNSSAWDDLEKSPDPQRKIIAFMDVDTCLEMNYPLYGIRKWWLNLEESPPNKGRFDSVVFNSCEYLKRAASSPALKANHENRLVVLDCSGSSEYYLQNACEHDPTIFQNDQVIIAYMSADEESIRTNIDVGLPPPAVKPVDLAIHEKYLIQQKPCHKRRYLFSFQGRGGAGRERLGNIRNDNDDMYIRIRNQKSYIGDIRAADASSAGDSMDYKRVMKDSIFAGAPRGDNLFSYRFAEILSAGTIPVVYADHWVPPFDKSVVDWAKCAVFIPESEYDKTGDILRAIPDEVRCEMQQCALDVWDRFVSSRTGWVDGLVASALSLSRSSRK
jgi:hypothetical protein